MHYHIILTELCNSQCRYCYEKSMKEFDNGLDKTFKFDFSAPEVSDVDVKKLKQFLEKDEKPVLVFYGGEPLLEMGKIATIMDYIDVPFRMQTNGKLLDEFPKKYLNRIEKILISLDGTKERTDHNRGKGTYDKVMKNIDIIRENGYRGELIARMTISFPDIYEQVLSLINAGFSSVHWQLDAGFHKFDYNKEKFSEFVNVYNKSLTKLINFWINEMYKGNVLKLYPLLEIMQDILQDNKSKLRCGAGYAGYAIATNGKIVACPVMNGIENFYAGDIDDNPSELKKFSVSGKCLKCSERGLCGGRCLYWNQAKLWPEDGDELICRTVKHLINELKAKKPDVQEMIQNKLIKMQAFEHERYFGPEIIP